ncbi:MAG TPA: hypothetical protein VNZ52_16115 [Candidatus Thermoplasmatota archaeon]|nr:hypothetical protein [Candidatus Thermoplasmatota archaeon]
MRGISVLLVAMALVPLLASPATAQTQLDQPSTTTLRFASVEEALLPGEVLEVPLLVEVTYSSAATSTQWGPMEVTLEVTSLPEWVVASLQPATLVLPPPQPWMVQQMTVTQVVAGQLALGLAKEVPAATLGSIEVRACLQPTTGVRSSCGVSSVLFTTGAPACLAGDAVAGERLEPIEAQSAGAAGVPLLDMVAMGISATVGAIAGAVAVRLTSRRT